MRVATVIGKAPVAVELTRAISKLVAGGLPDRDVPVDVFGQHDDTSGHGWAIWASSPKSTFA